MENSQFKRNIVAVLVAIPIIGVLSLLTSIFDDSDSNFWDWDIHIDDPAQIFSSEVDGLKQVVDLNGKWLFETGDDLERASANFDDSSWDTIKVPVYWENEGHKNYDGFAWYRRNFKINKEDLDKSLYVVLGQIDDTDETFINGVRVGGLGQFPPTYIGAYNQDRKYSIPADLLHADNNVIAVRVYDAQMGGGIYRGNIGIYASKYPVPLMSLEGEWQLRTENEGAPPRAIQVPGAWEHQGLEGYDGMAWYKKEFGSVNLAGEETLVLLLGKVDDTDEVTINGTLIGRTGNLNDNDRKIDRDYYNIKRHYNFPASVLGETNTIEVRVHDSGGFGGIYEGPVGIYTVSAYEKSIKK